MEDLNKIEINLEKINKAAKEGAEEAYLDVIRKYYTDYDSPYKKQIKEALQNQDFDFRLELPEILSKINESLSSEVDAIANNAVAATYIPLLQKALTGYEKEISFNSILQDIINELDIFEADPSDFSFHYEENTDHGWLNCELTVPDANYEFTLHTVKDKKEDKTEFNYQLLGFPSVGSRSNQKITMYKNDVSIEIPFTPNIVQDKVMTVFMRLLLGKCHINMNNADFDEDMFPREECHC